MPKHIGVGVVEMSWIKSFFKQFLKDRALHLNMNILKQFWSTFQYTINILTII